MDVYKWQQQMIADLCRENAMTDQYTEQRWNELEHGFAEIVEERGLSKHSNDQFALLMGMARHTALSQKYAHFFKFVPQHIDTTSPRAITSGTPHIHINNSVIMLIEGLQLPQLRPDEIWKASVLDNKDPFDTSTPGNMGLK